MLWRITLVSDLLIAATCLATAILLGRKTARSPGPGRTLPFGIAIIFLTIASHHFVRAVQLLYPVFGVDEPLASAGRVDASDWHIWLASAGVALASLGYLRFRGRYGTMLSGPALYEDLDAGHRRAIGLHDTVVQSLTQAMWGLDLGRRDRAVEAIDQAIAQAEELLAPGGHHG